MIITSISMMIMNIFILDDDDKYLDDENKWMMTSILILR